MQEVIAKQTWETPRLVILGRGTPEENVLLGCKQHPTDLGKGPGELYPCLGFDTPCDTPVTS